MEYEDENYSYDSVYEESEIDSYESTKRPMKGIYRNVHSEYKKMDMGYFKYRLINDAGQYSTAESYFTHMVPGNSIRNAVNGDRMHEYKVGSLHEHLFFKVCDARSMNLDGPMTFYYLSPEQYERHLNVTVPVCVKEKWLENNLKIRKISV
jgi:hypothetical protein